MRMILNPVKAGDIAIKGVIFDMDGTLCLPQTYMFKQMRDALGIDKSIDILDYVHSLPAAEEEVAQEKLRNIELTAMIDMQPQPGLHDIMQYLETKSLPKTICTRNFPRPVEHLKTKFLKEFSIHPIVTREFKPPKPHPSGILHIAQTWGIDPKNLIMVGDSVDDMHAGFRAGAATILLQSNVNTHLNELAETDLVVDSLSAIIDAIEKGFPVKPKTPDSLKE